MPCCECHNKTTGKIISPLCAYTGNVAPNAHLGIPPINMNDGPQGFRESIYPGTTTAWPSGLTVAASWDVVAMGQWGDGMGKEFFAKGANVQLGPGVCIARVPRAGRNFEYLSGEDPFLGYTLVGPVVKGIQAHNVVANAKHYVQNNQETNRGSVDEIVDERTRFEIYYPVFEGAAKAGVGSVMCSYNKIDTGAQPGGVWSCENPVTLGDLKEKLGFEGYVMSDWGATHSTSIAAGLDMQMPDAKYMGSEAITAGLAAKNVSTANIDDSVTRTLTAMFAVGVIDKFAEDPMAYDSSKHSANVTTEASAMLARKLSAESTVLLKNDGGILPLKPGKKLAIIGLADTDNALTHAGGSGEVTPSFIATPLSSIKAAYSAATATYDDGKDSTKAAAAAKAADVAIVFVGTLSSEGSDRKSLSLDDGGPMSTQNALIEAVAAAQPEVVVVLSVPGAILCPWSAKVKGLLTNFMPGQQAGNAIADVLLGKVNPSGKLPLTFPNKEDETEFAPDQWPGLPDPHNPTYANYTERLLVGYRYYDEKKIDFTTGFPFGHGLSYTTFKYSGLTATKNSVSVSLQNSGTAAGAEVVQVYLGFPAAAGEPPKQLKGFAKVQLAAGAKQTVTIPLTERETSIWSVEKHGWATVAGKFEVFVGSSSRDIRLTGSFTA
eukprot:SAG22_NODE_350_length_11853_cov_3.693211_12_plen_662_part_00